VDAGKTSRKEPRSSPATTNQALWGNGGVGARISSAPVNSARTCATRAGSRTPKLA
jgi:hypothetical protein